MHTTAGRRATTIMSREELWRDDLDERRATNKMRSVAAGRMMPTLIDAGKDYGEGWLSRGVGTPTFLGVA